MSRVDDLLNNEKLLEKVATAETKEDARKVCKEEGLEVTDVDLDAVAGGLTTVHKVLIGVGAAAGTAVATAGTYYAGKHFGWWGKTPDPEELRDKKIAEHAASEALKAAHKVRDERKKFRADIAGEVGNYGDVINAFPKLPKSEFEK